MFDRVDFHIALDDGRCAFDQFHILGAGIDDRLIGKVGASEFVAVIFWGRVDGEGNIFTCVQRSAFERRGRCESSLFFHGLIKGSLVWSMGKSREKDQPPILVGEGMEGTW